MTKRSVLLIAVVLFSTSCLSQLLEGEWKGYFTYSDDSQTDRIRIFIIFKKLNDTTFEGVSKTILKHSRKKSDTSICVLRGGFYEGNTLLLEETRVLKDFKDSNGCLQLMKLYYTEKKKYTELKGDWYTEDEKCGNGTIVLTKQL